jgi:hypothetical protein
MALFMPLLVIIGGRTGIIAPYLISLSKSFLLSCSQVAVTSKGGHPVNFSISPTAFLGSHGSLSINSDDEVAYKLAMLIKGECSSAGPANAAQEFGFSRQRYFQLRTLYHQKGASGLVGHKRGPKTTYRRTREVVHQVVRYRFLDPEMSGDVITQKLNQNGFAVSARSVDRVLAEFGLQKKTLSIPPGPASRVYRKLSDREKNASRTRRSPKPRARRPPTSGG